MPGQTNIDAKNIFNSEDPPEKLDKILPPDIDQSVRNYDEGYDRIFGKKRKQELKEQDND